MLEATTDSGYRQIIGTETDTFTLTVSYLAVSEPVLLSPEKEDWPVMGNQSWFRDPHAAQGLRLKYWYPSGFVPDRAMRRDGAETSVSK